MFVRNGAILFLRGADTLFQLKEPVGNLDQHRTELLFIAADVLNDQINRFVQPSVVDTDGLPIHLHVFA